MKKIRPFLQPRTDHSRQEMNEGRGPAVLDDHFFQAIASFSHALFYSAEEEVVVRGDESRLLYYVEKGSVEVSHTVDATRVVVALIGPGNFFGEIGFFDGVSRVRDIRATEDSIIRVFDGDSMADMQKADPHLHGDFVTFMARSICDKFRRILEESEPLTAYSASLSTGRNSFTEAKPIPSSCFLTKEWHHVNKLVEDFKASFFDLSHQLQQDTTPYVSDALYRNCFEVMDNFNGQLEEAAVLLRKHEFADHLWGYAFKEIFPYFMRSRFAERAYYKPRGYAGDYLMMEMIYRNEPDGDGKLGKIMDGWCLDTAAARAVRGRRKYLRERLDLLCRTETNTARSLKIMNLACGSSRELFDFLAGCDYSDRISALCIDADLKALEYTNHVVNVIPHGSSVRLMNDNILRWALGKFRHNFGTQDIIYSAGLADYLDDRMLLALINRCYEHLKRGGTLIIGNFGEGNENKAFLHHILQWRIIHRTADDLRKLFTRSRFSKAVRVEAEENGVNLFVIASRTD